MDQLRNHSRDAETQRKSSSSLLLRDSAVKNIVVATIGAIGDVILTTPLLEALRSAFPRAHLSYLVGSTAAPVLQHLPLVDELLILPDQAGPNRWVDFKLMIQVIRHRFDLAICLTRAAKLALIFWLARIPTRVGYSPVPFSWTFTHLIDSCEAETTGAHRTGYFLAAATAIGIPPPDPVRLHYQVTAAERAGAHARLESARCNPRKETIVAIHPGTSRILIEKRRWAVENFIDVARHVMTRPGRKVVLLGGPEESGIAEAFQTALPGRIIDFSGRLDLREFAAVLELCHLLVHNDSSALHIAGAVGTPVLPVFGYQNQKLWGPLGPHDRVVRRELPCSPCLPEFPCDRSFECIRKLQPATVIEALDSMLDQMEIARSS